MQKKKITRPQFLIKLLSGEITEDSLKQVLPYHYKKVYGCYSILKPYDFDHSDLLDATVDAEDGSITLRMKNKNIVNELKEIHHKTRIMVGESEFLVAVKSRKDFVVFNLTPVEREDIDE